MKINTTGINWGRVLICKINQKNRWQHVQWNFALPLVLPTPKLTVTQPQCYVCNSSSQPRVSLPFLCQCTLNTRLNTYSSKTSKRRAAFQIHYGSEVPTALVEHPMERTASGHRLPHVHFHCFQIHAWNKTSWGKIKYWICLKFCQRQTILCKEPFPKTFHWLFYGLPTYVFVADLLQRFVFCMPVCADDPKRILMTLICN